MIKTMKTLMLTLASAGALLFPALVPVAVHAQDIQNNLCDGADFNFDSTAGTCANTTAGADDDIENTIETIINVFSVVVGVISVIMIIYGGLRYILSGGDSGNVGNAKNTIIYAIVGLIIVALSQIIVQFVLGQVT